MTTNTAPLLAPAPLVITVHGVPAPQGSKSAFALRKAGVYTGRVAIVEDAKHRTRPWRQLVTAAAVTAMAGAAPLAGPLAVSCVLTMPKPKSAPKRQRAWACKRPDRGKLERAIEDALTDAGVWGDDAQVVIWTGGKFYAGDGSRFGEYDVLDSPGAVIRIRQIGGTR